MLHGMPTHVTNKLKVFKPTITIRILLLGYYNTFVKQHHNEQAYNLWYCARLNVELLKCGMCKWEPQSIVISQCVGRSKKSPGRYYSYHSVTLW